MVQDFSFCGFNIVNSDALKHYFSGPVKQSRLNLEEEKIRYEEALGNAEFRKLQDGYERVPEIQKPFYSMQFAFLVARKESEKRERAELRAKLAEKTESLTAKERNDFQRLKAKEEERRQKGKKKARRKQSQKKTGRKKRG